MIEEAASQRQNSISFSSHISFFLAAIPGGKAMKKDLYIHRDNCILLCPVFSGGNLLKNATDEFGA